MTSIAVQIDSNTEQELYALSSREGTAVETLAARLLSRAVRAARPKRSFDSEELRPLYSQFADEDAALADSGLEERAALIAAEDIE